MVIEQRAVAIGYTHLTLASDMSQVLKTTVFLADMENYNKLNEIYRRHFKEHPPARSTIQVARLPRNALIEIEAVALVKQ